MSSTDASVKKRTPAVPRPSASNPHSAGKASVSSSEPAYDYRVCLIQRHAKMQTLGGVTVFPGGNLSPEDSDAAREVSPSPATDEAVQMTAMRLCAIRETFEECGILVGLPEVATLEARDVTKWRAEIYNKPGSFLSTYHRIAERVRPLQKPPLEELTYWSKWTTPVVTPKRFETFFFLHILGKQDAGQLHSSPILSADGTETASAEWVTPREAIESCLRDRTTVMLPPQVYLLAELARLPTLEAVRAHAQQRLVLHIQPVMIPPKGPSAVQDRRALVYAGDEHHPDDRLAGPLGARHRTYVAAEPAKDGTGKIVPVAPMHVIGVQRLGVSGVTDIEEGNVSEGSSRNGGPRL